MDDFKRIKGLINIQQFIERETGLRMKGHHLEECPFCHGHDCFSIKTEEGFYKCFQCGTNGDCFSFLEAYHKIDTSEALKQAAEFAGIKLTPQKEKEQALTTKERIFLEATSYYHSGMLNNGGREYLITQRGHDEGILTDMRVGWADGGLVEHLRGKGFPDKDIKASGIAKELKKNQATFLTDFFIANIAIFPHFYKNKVLHFTIKDPQKKFKYQLPEKTRSKEWKFYNQDALKKYNEIVLVEGENDLLSCLDSGVKHVIGMIGQPADYQIKALKDNCKGKHLYLWLDNDEGGKQYIRKICQSLKEYNVRIIVYKAKKDPDEYIRAFEGNRKKEIRRLQDDAINYISWEISDIASLKGLDNRIKALKDRNIFQAVADMVQIEQLVYIEKLQTLGLTRSAIEEQLEHNQELITELNLYYENLSNKRDADPNYIAGKIFNYFSRQGRFFYDGMNKVYLLFQHKIFEVATNRPFNALLKRYTKLLPTKEPGRSVWESLASEAYISGVKIDLATWIHTERNTDVIYINLNSPNNMIIKVSKESIKEIPNGLNEDGVLLKSSQKIMPMNYLPDCDIQEGMTALRELIFDNLTCDREQRYLIICWLVTAFMLDFAPYMGLMKFSGPTSSGKTTAARLLSLLIYGDGHLGDPSAAAAFALASQNPLLIIDNLESDEITKSILKFFLLSATKGGKEKRTSGTESDTTQEQPKALVLITAIEPFIKAELINRTYDIEFSFRHKADDFIEDEIIRAVVKKRDLILSSIIKIIHKEVLPNLHKRKDYISILKREYKNHSKNRTDEYLALLMLILESILKHIPYYDDSHVLAGVESGEKEVRKAWIEYQDAKAKDTETASNNIIKLLDGLVREYIMKMKDLEPTAHYHYDEDVFVYQHPEYMIELVKTKPKVVEENEGEQFSIASIEFISTSGEISSAFDRYCKNNGIRNPYSTASIFSSRLKNDKHLLKKGGWELISRDGFEPYYTRVKGERFWKFRKTLVR